MRICYFINTAKSVNWGGQATSAGIKHLVERNYPGSEFVPLDLDRLPYSGLKVLRNVLDRKIAKAILDDDVDALSSLLVKANVDLSDLEGFDAVCFNGEGAVHKKSGHFYRFMGILYYFIRNGVHVSALNQTVDLGGDLLAQSVIRKVYSKANYVAVREPVSQRELEQIGIKANLVGDAAYAVPKLSVEECVARVERFDLPEKYFCVTGSSALARNRGAVKKMQELIDSLSGHSRAIVFLANAKTDLYLARKVAKNNSIVIVDYTKANYLDSMAIISKADLLVGGRQHPNIFAAIYGVPFIALAGNTHKNEGVLELLKYPLEVVGWDDLSKVTDQLKLISESEDFMSSVEVPVVSSIVLNSF